MPYRYLEDIATADIAFSAWSESLEGTFQAAAAATLNVMVEDPDRVRREVTRPIRLENTQLDLMLFDLLQEIIYYKDSEELLLHISDIYIEETEDGYRLEAMGAGETLDPEIHRLQVDVKAVTLHRFRLEKTDGGWNVQVILDI
ncbi:MAG: archease [Desulfobacteraceae bacterium]|nr:MAG: archease [Desulfobacteraceae bacterium]